jgi:simple sugar transport system ATP-binding protein
VLSCGEEVYSFSPHILTYIGVWTVKFPLLIIEYICKYFSRVVANKDIHMHVYPGEVHALLGENGSGKTTLMNCVYGLYTPDKGRIVWEGEVITHNSTQGSIRRGMGMVHQHFMLVQDLTVFENIMLGLPWLKKPFINKKKVTAKIESVLQAYNINIDLDARVGDLSVGQQQWVEIIKVLCLDAKLLILDEPTASLTPEDVRNLFSFLRDFVSNGNSVVLITHKLEEVLQVSDRVSVLRDGELIRTSNTEDVDKTALAELLVGRELVIEEKDTEKEPGDISLEVDAISSYNNGIPALEGVSFTVRSGEILGIAGVAGNGQTELSEVLNGLRNISEGDIRFKGRSIKNLPPRALSDLNIAHIPEDRHLRGLILDFSVKENAIMGVYHKRPYSKGIRLDHNYIYTYTKELIDNYGIKTPDQFTEIRRLSGGNQQKLVLARELSKDPELIVLAFPTRGLDIGAAEFVREQIFRQKEKGASVIYISGEMEELFSISDKIAVFYKGTIVGCRKTEELDEKTVGLMMAGSHTDNQ